MSHHQQDHPEIDEVLELLFHLREHHDLTLQMYHEHEPRFPPELLQRLEQQGLVAVAAERITLTPAGLTRAEQITRRHRLAERLLADVLHMSQADMEKGACAFEHMVADEITDSICTLLGHPRTCPHGHPIPEGACCREFSKECRSAVAPLLEAPLGVWARIAYINSRSDERQHRLTHFGVVPGAAIKLHQLKPSVVIVLEETTLAMEEGIARDILVWRKWEAAPQPEPKRRRGWRGLFGRAH